MKSSQTKNKNGTVNFEVKVHDPMRQGEGLKSHISYKIDTSQEKIFAQSDSATHLKLQVVRRFSDFIWLRHTLIECHPGIIIPVLPEKSRRFSITHSVTSLLTPQAENAPPADDERLEQLQLFLMRITQHPTLKEDPFLYQFLALDSEAFAQQKNHKPAKEGFGLSKVTNEIKKLLSHEEGNDLDFKAQPGDDMTFISAIRKLANLESASNAVFSIQQEEKQTEKNIAASLSNLSDSFSALSQRVWTEDETVKWLGYFAKALESSAKILSESERNSSKVVEMLFKDFYRQAKGAYITVCQYKSIKNEYEAVNKILNEKLVSINKADVDVEKETERLTKLKFQCSNVEKCLKSEIEIFNKRQLASLKKALRALCLHEIQKNKRVAAEWRQLV